ncbi:unnamed protein product [Gadus morhua 'NCC']
MWAYGAALVCQRAASGWLLLGLLSGVAYVEAALGETCGSLNTPAAAGFTSLAALRNQIEDQLRGRGHQGE